MSYDLRYKAVHFFMTCKLDSTLIGRDLSLQDNEFVECVVYDVQYFVKSCNDNSSKSVLVFPPVNNYRRFLIHKVVEEQSQDLSTFSIGQGHARRTVVCFKRHVIKKPTLQNEIDPALTTAMGVDLDGSPNNETVPKRAKAMPAMGIYRPPAARKLEEQVLSSSVPAPPPEKPRSGKTRRPDIQVYVPRAKRLEVNRKCSLGLSRSSEESVDSVGHELSENKKNQRNSRGNRLSSPNVVISAESHNSSPPSNKRKPEHKLLTHSGKPVKVKHVSADVHVEKKVKQDDVNMDVVISGMAEEEKDNKIHITSAEGKLEESTDAPETASTSVGRKQMPERKFQSDVLMISESEPVDTKELSVKKLLSDILIISESEPADTKELSRKNLPSDVLIISDSEPVDTKEPSKNKLPSDVLIISESEPADTKEPSGKKLPSDVLIISDLEPVDTKESSRKKLPSDVLIISESEPTDTKEPLKKKLPPDVLIISDSEPADCNIGTEETLKTKLPSDVLPISESEPSKTKLLSDVLIISESEPSKKKLPPDVLIISESERADTKEPSKKKLPPDVLISDIEPSNSTGTKQTPLLEKNTATSQQVVETKSKKTEQQKQVKEREVPLNLNPDECTWDMLFDDNGDCLDPRLMEELTSAVGSVTIEKPQSDYRSYQSRVEMMLSGNAEDEFAHVLEIYNFPPEFKTHDLFTVFSPYMKNGFEIKWVDDTHALGVFSSALIAAEVLATDHPFVKTRPLNQATPESRMKARRSAEFLQPYRARPETCAAMARRLVTGALGVRLRTSAEEREAERRLLREARERKRLAARQRDEAWEGTLMSNK